MTINSDLQSKNVIFCYSGTGNCLASAKQLSEILDIPIRFIDAETVERKEKIECDTCIIIFPAYAYAPPKLVRKFVQECQFNVDYLAILTTFGSSGGGALAELVRLFKRKNQNVTYVNGIRSIENYVHIFGYKSEDEIERLTQKQRELTEQIAVNIRQRVIKEKCLFTPVSVCVSTLFKTFKPLLVLGYKTTSECNGCGFCARVCPPRAISIKENGGKFAPVFDAKACDHCQGCMHLCPQKAIKYLRVKPDSKRYIHSDVTPSELIKR